MVSHTLKVVVGAASIYMMAQQVQCPAYSIGMAWILGTMWVGAAAWVAFTMSPYLLAASFEKRDINLDERPEIVLPPGVPQFEFERCCNDLAQESVTIIVDGPVSNNGIQIDGLPASCMNLAAVIDVDAVDAADGPLPQPCGSACLLYDNLSQHHYDFMRNGFNEVKNGQEERTAS